jgi:hypothetical protein
VSIYILNDPIDAIAVIELAVIHLGEEGLLSEGSQGEQAGQALAEMAEDGGHGQGIQPLQLPGRCNVKQLQARPNIHESLLVFMDT